MGTSVMQIRNALYNSVYVTKDDHIKRKYEISKKIEECQKKKASLGLFKGKQKQDIANQIAEYIELLSCIDKEDLDSICQKMEQIENDEKREKLLCEREIKEKYCVKDFEEFIKSNSGYQ